MPVEGYEDYYLVSNLGRVRGMDRTVVRSDGVAHFVAGQLITGVKNQDGYLQVKLCRDGKYKTVRVHQLVARAFLGPAPEAMEINHLDNDRTNNCVNNLEYCSHADNVRQAIASGNHVCTRDLTGANNPNYGNHILADRYRNNPDLAKEMLARPGAQNGRAKRVTLCDLDEQPIKTFGCILDCASYMVEHGLIDPCKPSSITYPISVAMKVGKPYKYYCFKPA